MRDWQNELLSQAGAFEKATQNRASQLRREILSYVRDMLSTLSEMRNAPVKLIAEYLPERVSWDIEIHVGDEYVGDGAFDFDFEQHLLVRFRSLLSFYAGDRLVLNIDNSF